MKAFETPKGTKLPISSISGKDYLQVAPRIHWFREEHPDWTIETEFVAYVGDHATVKATIKDPTGRIIQTAHKSEDKKDFKDFAEKAETGAIGRAIANCGFGTLMALELDEGERIVDAPQVKAQTQPGPYKSAGNPTKTITPSPASQRTIKDLPNKAVSRPNTNLPQDTDWVKQYENKR